jgi:hypothetical protein
MFFVGKMYFCIEILALLPTQDLAQVFAMYSAE